MLPGVSSLPFFGMVVRLYLATSYIILSSPSYNQKLKANGEIPVLEWQLPPIIIGGVFFTGGLFWFGWTRFTDRIPWIVPTLSGLFTGFGLLVIFI
jgi:DHA1 family multidrug resistance protein-like MFS transporter